MATALTIAGSDPSGGAGLQVDLKVFHQHGVYGMAVVTLLTVQNTLEVKRVDCIGYDMVLAQLEAVLEDIPPQAAKTGALGNGEVIDAVAFRARNFNFPLVVDPVMVSKHGASLLDPEALEVFKKELLPHTYLVTPNIHEAELLSEQSIQSTSGMERAARSIQKLGVSHVLVKGGHLADEPTDVLFSDGQIYKFTGKRFPTAHTHGTGCALSAAITAWLARGNPVLKSVGEAKQFIQRAIESNPGLGKGNGPINLFAPIGA